MPANCSRCNLGAILVPNLGGFLGSLVVNRNLKPWYDSLKKPSWVPPNWIFGPVWIGMYSTIGCASYLVWKNGGGYQGPARIPMIVYGGHLVLNWAWTPIFFGAHKIKLALYEIIAVDVAAATTAYLFYKIDHRAGFMFIPYLLWLGFATALNYRMAKDNSDEGVTITEVKDD